MQTKSVSGLKIEKSAFNFNALPILVIVIVIVIMTQIIFDKLSDYLKFFSLLGLSPRVHSHACKSNPSRIRIVLFIIFYLVLDVICAMILNSALNHDKPIELTVANVMLVSDIMKVIATMIQSFVYSRTLCSILFAFRHVDRLFVNLEQWSFDYRFFRKPLIIKIITIVVCYVLNVGSFAISNIPIQNGFWQSVIFKFWHLASAISFIHIIFYVDLLGYHLQQLNLCIQNKSTQNRLGRTAKRLHMTRKMMNLKLIYFKLWEISQQINATFGWTITALLFQQFLNSTYCLYWLIFLSVQRVTNTIAILRKLKCFSSNMINHSFLFRSFVIGFVLIYVFIAVLIITFINSCHSVAVEVIPKGLHSTLIMSFKFLEKKTFRERNSLKWYRISGFGLLVVRMLR